MRLVNVIWLGVPAILGVGLGCNTLIGLELGEPETTGSGGNTANGASSSSAQGTGAGTATGSSGVGANGGAGGSAQCDTMLPTHSPMCEVCAEISCCAQLMDCEAEPECVTEVLCRENCLPDDDVCLDACEAAAPVGHPVFIALKTCFFDPCGQSCGYAGTQICDSAFGLPGTDPASVVCAECLGAPGCCEDFKACGSDANCYECWISADMAACDATTLDEALEVCFTVTCADECD
jgi:hypothetical protein